MTIGQTLMLKINAALAVRGAKQFQGAAAGVSGSALAAGKSVNTLGLNLRMLVGGFLGLYVIRDAIKTMVDFEKTMRSVQVVVGLSDEKMKGLNKTARELGATTRFTATEAGEGMAFLARAGFETHDVMEMIPHTLNLATAAVIELGAASDMVANTIHQFNLTGRDAERVVDSLMITANSFNTTVFQLGNAMQYAGTFAGALGISLEETNVALGLMANTGIKSSMAGTALRGVFAALIKPTDKAMRAIKRLGLTAADVNPAIHTLEEVFHSLNEAGKKLGDSTEFAALMLQIFARRPVPGALALAELNEEMGTAVQRQRDLAEETARAAAMMDDTFFGSLKMLRSAIQETWLSLGDTGLGGALRALVDVMTGTARMFAGMSYSVEKFYGWAKALSIILKFIVARFVAMMVIKMVIGLFFSLLSVVVMLTKGFKGLAAAQSLTIVGAIASAVAILITMYWEWAEGIAAVEKQQEKVNDAMISGMNRVGMAKDAETATESIQHLSDSLEKFELAKNEAFKSIYPREMRIIEDMGDDIVNYTGRKERIMTTKDDPNAEIGWIEVYSGEDRWVKPSKALQDYIDAIKNGNKYLAEMIAEHGLLEQKLTSAYTDATSAVTDYSKASTTELKAIVDSTSNLIKFINAMTKSDIAKNLGHDADFVKKLILSLNELADTRRKARGQLGMPTGDDEAAEKVFEMIEALDEQIAVMHLVGDEKRRAIAFNKIWNEVTKAGTSLHWDEAMLLMKKNFILQDGIEARAKLTEEQRKATAEAQKLETARKSQIEATKNHIASMKEEILILQQQIAGGTEAANAIDLQRVAREAWIKTEDMAFLLRVAYMAHVVELTKKLQLLKAAQDDSIGAFDALNLAMDIKREQAAPKDEADAFARVRYEQDARMAWQEQYGMMMEEQGKAELDLLMKKYDAYQKEKDLKEEMLVTNEQMAQAMTQGIMDVVKGAKSMEEAFVGVVLQLVEMIIQAVIYKMIMGAMGGIFPGGGIGAARQGAVMSGGDMQNFATGGVVHRPTMFPMASGGVGLMGEAGAEAIMPLTRMPSGDLGVKAQGGGGKNVIVNMNITTQDADSFRKSKKQIARDMGRGIKGAEM